VQLKFQEAKIERDASPMLDP